MAVDSELACQGVTSFRIVMASGPSRKGGFDLGGEIGMWHSLLPCRIQREELGRSHGQT